MTQEQYELLQQLLKTDPKRAEWALLHSAAARAAAAVADFLMAAKAVRERKLLGPKDTLNAVDRTTAIADRIGTGNDEISWVYLERLIVETSKEAIRVVKGL